LAALVFLFQLAVAAAQHVDKLPQCHGKNETKNGRQKGMCEFFKSQSFDVAGTQSVNHAVAINANWCLRKILSPPASTSCNGTER
jgi:hypothetical protein